METSVRNVLGEKQAAGLFLPLPVVKSMSKGALWPREIMVPSITDRRWPWSQV